MSDELFGFDADDPAPNWEEGGRVHNWRNHVGDRTRRLWATFTREQREALAMDADDLAGAEIWE